MSGTMLHTKLTRFCLSQGTIILFCILLLAAASSNAQNTWIQKADFGGGGNSEAISLSIGGKGYLGTGYNFLTGGFRKDFWEYNPDNNTWTQKANFGGGNRSRATAITIGDKGYVGLGYSDISPFIFKDFWEYDPINNTWKKKADFGGGARLYAIGFTIDDKGYVGPGFYYDDLWQYDPLTDTWTQKADFGGGGRTDAVGFSIGSKGYMGTGFTDANMMIDDFWEYDAEADAWTQKASFEGGNRFGAVGLSIGGKGYVGTGQSDNNELKSDFWEYDPKTNEWTNKADFGGGQVIRATGFSMEGKGYLGTGSGNTGYLSEFWEYTPDDLTTACNVPEGLNASSVSATTAKLNWDAVSDAIGYQVAYKAVGTTVWNLTHAVVNSKKLTGLTPETKYSWKVKSVCSTSPLVTSQGSASSKFTTAPLRMVLETEELSLEVFPHPFSASAIISLYLDENAHATIELFDLTGRKLQTILDKNLSAGNHKVNLNRDQLSSGIYFIKLSTNGEAMMKKIIIE